MNITVKNLPEMADFCRGCRASFPAHERLTADRRLARAASFHPPGIRLLH